MKTSDNKNSISGSRRLARVKVLQMLMAYFASQVPWQQTFDYIFEHDFSFEAEEDTDQGKLLTREEIAALEADKSIYWSPAHRQFALKYVRSAVDFDEEAAVIINELARNWKADRIASVDRVVLKMAIVEFLHFPEVPIKVTINECIELAKGFSTGKSNEFVNGMLEAIAQKLKAEGKIVKNSRGEREK